jgi:hypothetical protein
VVQGVEGVQVGSTFLASVLTGGPGTRLVTASVRTLNGDVIEDRTWENIPVDVLAAAAPWRTFRWHMGQRHYSGVFWSSTQRDHVIYESRLELAVLLSADFDPSVVGIVAQPFLLRTLVGGVIRRHVPDYLLLTDAGPVVVDVKPGDRVDRPEIAATFAWTREVVEARGWRFEVRSEPAPVRLANLRFLAGYRRDWLFDVVLLDELRAADLVGVRLGDAPAQLPERPAPLVRSALFHLIWSGYLIVDLERPLSASRVLTVSR